MSTTALHAPKRQLSEGPQSQVEYLRQCKRDHGYSKGVARLYDLAMSYVEDAEKGHRAGRPAVWASGIYEAPLFYACDTVPISMTELGRLGSQAAITVADDFFQLPKESCSMVRSLLGEWFLRRDVTSWRLVMFNNICEPMNMGYELIRDHGYEVYRVEGVRRFPENDVERNEQMVRFLTKEVEDLAYWLSGKRLDEARMAGEIARLNRILGKARRIIELRLKNPLYVKSLAAMFLLMGTGHSFGKPAEFEETLDLLIEEIETADYVPSPKGKIAPLAWLGGRGQEFGVYKAIDDCGGAVLAWRIPTSFAYDWRTDVPPLESMAHFILSHFGNASPVQEFKLLEDLLGKAGAKGIFFYMYVGCSFAGVQTEMLRDNFRKKGIPSITLEGSFQVGPPTGQLLTRVRAFIEMLS
jgi:benzoyl-CoA reductase/2-hydroxyglutaryl-CoA dehydratase subunit BcrC/BadD/HgdB